MKSTAGGRASKPAKPYKDYPLTAHPNGHWCKKIRGRIHYFGPWADPQSAAGRSARWACASA